MQFKRSTGFGGPPNGDFPRALHLLGCCYEEGDGVGQDDAHAVECYRQAAEQDYAPAINDLGLCYARAACGLTQDYVQAAALYRRAAELGNGTAQNNLGDLLYKGLGVQKDVGEAFRWFERAAEKGSVSALYNLGLCYEMGSGVRKDSRKAEEYYRRAAEKDHKGAMLTLGRWFLEGRSGFKKDPEQAKHWLEQAAALGSEEAKDELEKLRKESQESPKKKRFLGLFS